MTSAEDPEGKADSTESVDISPASQKFNIEFNSETWTDTDISPFAYFKNGEVTFGDQKLYFKEYHPYGDGANEYPPDPQWKEAAERLLSGHDRTAFCLPDDYKRVPVWREGERVYTTLIAEDIPDRSHSHRYAGIKSLPPKIPEGRDALHFISLQAIRDYLAAQGVTPSQLEELERPCSECGNEMRRCNRCEKCLNCQGGAGDVELGYCVKCENISEPLEPLASVQNVNEPTLDDEQPSASDYEDYSTEADSLECDEGGPSYAISQLRNDPSSQRKLFLAGCAWARRFWERLGKRSRTSIEVFERFADGEATHGDFMTAFTEAGDAWHAATAYMDDPDAERAIVLPARGVLSVGRRAYIDASDEFYMARGDGAEYQAQCDIILDIFGKPSRPVSLEALWLTANEGAVATIAQAIYDERAFNRLPELADALETSGCHNRHILEHCRSQGEHVRGCWVIDLLLGKDKIEFSLRA